jgi:hypothetical protein
MDVNDLRDNLATTLEGLKAGTVRPELATAMAALASQMIASAKVQVAYDALKNQRPAIPFLDSAKATPASVVHLLRDDEPAAPH